MINPEGGRRRRGEGKKKKKVGFNSKRCPQKTERLLPCPQRDPGDDLRRQTSLWKGGPEGEPQHCSAPSPAGPPLLADPLLPQAPGAFLSPAPGRRQPDGAGTGAGVAARGGADPGQGGRGRPKYNPVPPPRPFQEAPRQSRETLPPPAALLPSPPEQVRPQGGTRRPFSLPAGRDGVGGAYPADASRSLGAWPDYGRLRQRGPVPGRRSGRPPRRWARGSRRVAGGSWRRGGCCPGVVGVPRVVTAGLRFRRRWWFFWVLGVSRNNAGLISFLFSTVVPGGRAQTPLGSVGREVGNSVLPTKWFLPVSSRRVAFTACRGCSGSTVAAL